ncbi:unnamed protein product [Caenorhabditis angaria]|uniref:Uncharacterized protein n=1 Tax=Caenorhabditis angaria TaxID=860376 RepID=A0A9P1IVC7_9PELO|nr:unnamed protein product [Caenorhabditis angaria]
MKFSSSKIASFVAEYSGLKHPHPTDFQASSRKSSQSSIKLYSTNITVGAEIIPIVSTSSSSSNSTPPNEYHHKFIKNNSECESLPNLAISSTNLKNKLMKIKKSESQTSIASFKNYQVL